MSESYIESLKVIQSTFRFSRRDLIEILLEVRSIAFGVKPWATERIRRTGVTLFDSQKGGTITGGICFVDILDDFVRVRFGRGALLNDPNSLLLGKQKYMRYVDLYTFDEAPWEDLELLIRESAMLPESVVRKSNLWNAHESA